MAWIRVSFRSRSQQPSRDNAVPYHQRWPKNKDRAGRYYFYAYVRDIDQLRTLWPDAKRVEVLGDFKHPQFDSSFPQPKWWVEPSRWKRLLERVFD